jgi:serine/threonine protein kinase
MPAPTTTEQFLDLVRKSGLVEDQALTTFLESQRATSPGPDSPRELARAMVQGGLVTRFQADQVLAGKSKGFVLAGKYKLLEHLGSGGMGSVYLCEHVSMRRRVALKVLPIARAADASYLERFYREARAVAALDHPNIVRAHDIDHDGKLHFLVMEYVDGCSLQDVVSKHGPLEVARASHYMSQAAWGLQHAHEAGIVHRDIKPANLLVDRSGTVKILDMGLARFFHDDDGLSKRFDETVLGTSDYLAPEQTLHSNVDIRADIYSLGATFYYCLTGQTLFGEGRTAQKLIWHQIRQPKPIRTIRPEVPEELAAVIEQKMLAKEPAQRFEVPAQVCEALAPWTAEPIAPPPAEHLPQLSPAAQRGGPSDSRSGPSSPTPRSKVSSGSGRSWRVSGPGTGKGVASPSPAPAAQSTAVQVLTSAPTDPSVGVSGPGSTTMISPSPPAAAGSSKVSRANESRDGRSGAAASAVRRRRFRPAGRTGRTPWLVWLAVSFGVIAVVTGGLWWALSGVLRPVFTAAEVPKETRRATGQVRFGPHGPEEVFKGPGGKEERGPAPPPAGAGQDRRFKEAAYEAVVGPDGNLTSLRVGGVEFLRTGVRFGPHVARGSYFFFDKENAPGVVKLTNIEQPAKNVLKATGDRFTVVYEFGPDSLTLKLTNATDHTVPFFLIFDPVVSRVVSDQGEVARTPVKKEWPTTTWFAGKSRLAITGGTRIWGPWEQGCQVWEASLPTYGSRTVVLTSGTATQDEAAGAAAAAAGLREMRKPAYEAVVEADGCLTSLRIGGADFLRAGADISRGLYLHNGKDALRLPQIEEPAKDTLTAQGAPGALCYQFADDAITLTAENRTEQPMNLFIVFDPHVTAVRNAAEEWAKTPLEGPADKKWHTTTWYAGAAKLTISGGNRVWGPWTDARLEVWEASLAPKESRQVVLQASPATQEEIAKVAEVTGTPAAQADLTIQLPRDYQVFQRRSRLEGEIRLRGRVRPACDRLEVRLTGKSLQGPLADTWQPLPLADKAGTFDHPLPAKAGGWYKVEVRALQGDKTVAQGTVEHVGVGEVFVGAGQSNSTNCGQERIKPESGLVATFDGYRWRPADDPQPGVHDNSGGGSYFPAFGDAMVAKYGVPIGIASAGHSGTSVNAWQPGGELCGWLVTRMRQLGPHGFRAVQWHQGESDVGMSADDYATRLKAVIEGSKQAAGWDFPWFVARVSYHNQQNTSFATTRDGQKKLWETDVALEGPDTDLLTGDNRDEGGRGIHFSPKGLRAHGRMWAEKVGAYLDRVLEK